MRRFTRALVGLLFTIVVGGIVVGVCLAALLPGIGIVGSATEYQTDLVTDLRDLSERSTVYDVAGNEMGVLGLENRQNVSLDQVPQVLIDAVVATEDKTFWENDGVDLPAVARAALKNLTSGEIEQGGSTISQQLVKNRILSPKRDLNRKIREVLLAIQLNKDYSKREILEQYLNTVYFGQGSYGVKSAVERLTIRPDPSNPFCGCAGATLETLSIADAAMLAGLIQSPEAYNPFLHPEKTLERRAFVLSQMVEEGYITQEQADAAKLEPLPSIQPPADLRPGNSWVEEVQDRLFTDPRYSVLGTTREERENAVLRGGLKIYTTLDMTAQQNAQNAVDESLGAKPGFTASIVAMDPTTGAVRAMVAGAGFADSQYNIATTTPGRQPGSTWKTITLAAALQKRFSANDLVDGTSPCEFGNLGRTQNAEGGGGVMTLRSASQNSVNCAYARIELAVGFTDVIDMAKKLGITQNTLKPILTLTLGAIEATPLEMATVGSTIAARGVRHDPYFVEKIVNPQGIVIYQEQHAGVRALDEEAADCEIDILRGTVTSGTGTGAAVPGWAVAGKTGTTDTQADAWFLGMTPKLVAAVWHGNPDARVPGAGYGGQVPASIFRRFMTAQLSGVDPVGWNGPPAWCNAPGQFLSQAGRQSVPSGFEIRDGQLVPATLPPPTAVVNTVPTTRPPTPTTTRPPAPTTTAPPAPTTTAPPKP
jgi:penicillin-binding protein 1A